MKYIELLVPAFLTIIMNILFYIFIKIKSEQAIQKYSITYSGVFMERLTIYRKLLEEIFDLKVSLSEHIQEDKEETEELLKKFNGFIKCCKINEPLLSDSLSKNLRKLDKEFRLITQEAVRAVNANAEKKAERDFTRLMQNAHEKKELLQKIYKNELLKAVENNLINDMKADFQLNKIHSN